MDDLELFTKINDDFDKISIDNKDFIKTNSMIEKNKFSVFDENKSTSILLNEYNLCKKSNEYNLKLKNNILYNWIINFDNVEFELFFEQNLYPYYPPYLKLKKPIFKNNFIKDILGIKILTNSEWRSTYYMNDVILHIQKFIRNGIIESNSEYSDLDNNLIRLPLIINNKQKTYLNNKKKNKYWKSGIGYGNNDSNNWNMDLYILGEEIRNVYIAESLNIIYLCDLNYDNIKKIKESCFFDIIKNYLNTTILEISKNVNLYEIIFKILYKFINFINYDNIKSLYLESVELLKIEDSHYAKEIVKIYNLIIDKNNIDEKKEYEKKDYISEMKKEQFKFTNIYKNKNIIKILEKGNSNNNFIKIGKELVSLNKNLPLTESSSIFFRVDESDNYITQFIITGPENTPYSNGCFLFSMIIPSSYPNKPPTCIIETTGHKKVRFNANLYSCGKVCLSLLGTWNGQQSESWNPKSSTLLQVLISIQSLIFNDQPYFNEPGWERSMGTKDGDKESRIYNYQIRLNTMKWAILEQLKNPNKNFEKMIKKHFFLKKDIILKECLKWVEEFDNTNFHNVYNDSSLDWVNDYNEIKNEYNKIYNEISVLLNNIKL